ncbi:hypothetical protein SFRURICE_007099 [Spodoptera frugiperda]|nr:hypothetical protein SFRURICE_007099 [Spodoptera frugiperda]
MRPTLGAITTTLNLPCFLAFPFRLPTSQTIKETPKTLEYNSRWNLLSDFYEDDFFNGPTAQFRIRNRYRCRLYFIPQCEANTVITGTNDTHLRAANKYVVCSDVLLGTVACTRLTKTEGGYWISWPETKDTQGDQCPAKRVSPATVDEVVRCCRTLTDMTGNINTMLILPDISICGQVKSTDFI